MVQAGIVRHPLPLIAQNLIARLATAAIYANVLAGSIVVAFMARGGRG